MFSGASAMAELIGIQGFLMGGNGAARVIVTNEYGKSGTAKTFRFNASSVNDRGKDLNIRCKQRWLLQLRRNCSNHNC